MRDGVVEQFAGAREVTTDIDVWTRDCWMMPCISTEENEGSRCYSSESIDVTSYVLQKNGYMR